MRKVTLHVLIGQGDGPVTEDLADRLLRFPFFTGMSSSEQAQVIDAVRAFRS
jgi:dTDP-4-amino-4,6-dideoxygalactose transaminase